MHAYHYRCVPGSVLRYDNTVAFFFPLRGLVLHIGDGDCQLHRSAAISTIGCYDIPCNIGPL